MPPKAKITKEMIVDAAFEIARTEGAASINARTLSQKLNCSTQPVLYYFSTIEEIKNEVFQKADQYHETYITNLKGEYGNPLLEIAMLYIKFAVEEKKLFCFLFQSDKFVNRNLVDWTGDRKIVPIIEMMKEQAGLDEETAKSLFTCIYMLMHGYASMFANNSMEYHEEVIIENLQRTFMGIICDAKMKAEKEKK